MTLYYSPSDDHNKNLELFKANADFPDDNDAIRRARGNSARTFINYDNNISIRGEYNRADYDYFRQYEQLPETPREIMCVCNKAYQKVGPIRNVIDLMGDFGCQGIRLQHPVRSIERFYKRWFEYVRGPHVSERFLNYLYRFAIDFVRRWMGSVTIGDEREMKRIRGNDGLEIQMFPTGSRKIPLKYTFLNPMSINIVGGENISAFIGKPAYSISIPFNLRSELNTLSRQNRNNDFADILEDPAIKAIVSGKTNEIPLNPDEFEVFEYKKDDWQAWPLPMIYSVLDQVLMLSKLQLADLSALDGIISSVRLWKLGHINDAHPTHSILPTRMAIQKLRSILANTGNGPIDIVWGPELDFKESESKIYQLLGSAKYEPVWNAIYDGLGVPPVLRSGAKTDSGQTNSFISLKTLVERLQYGRNLLSAFWMKEIRIVQKAMNFPSPAQVVYDEIIVNDESAEKKLLIDLVDRNVVSEEAVQERFGYIPDIESLRIKRQEKKREKKKYPPKAGPFHDPQWENDFKKIVLQGGGVAPSEMGIELQEKKKGEKSLEEIRQKGQREQKKIQDSKKPVGLNNGRPKNITETRKRKPRREQPRSKGFVELFMWANSAQNTINEICLPAFLHVYGKKNLRQLSYEQFDEYENTRFALLSRLEPFSEPTQEVVYKMLEAGVSVDEEMSEMASILSEHFVEIRNRKPTVEELRQIQASSFALKFEVEDE